MAERPEDLNLPNSVITRIIKDAIPDGVNVSKDARLAISKAASVFVLYATSCSNNLAMQHKRKTISGQDVIDAMSEMEFDRFVEPLKQSLQAFKNEQKGKKEATERKKKAKEQNTSTENSEKIDEGDEEGGDEDGQVNGDGNEAAEGVEENEVHEIEDDDD